MRSLALGRARTRTNTRVLDLSNARHLSPTSIESFFLTPGNMTEPQLLPIAQTPNTDDDKVREADPSNDHEAIRKDRQLLHLHSSLSKSTYRYQKVQPSHSLRWPANSSTVAAKPGNQIQPTTTTRFERNSTSSTAP